MLKQLKKQGGNSLLNLIITLGIIGTTTALSAGQVDDILVQARNARRHLDIHQIQIALELYYSDMNQYPVANTSQPTEASWDKLIETLTADNKNIGPWISEATNDPLNEDGYVYKYQSDGRNYEIWYFLEEDSIMKKKILKSL
jgi:type II secretory pathway pseudopilin PulG